MDLSSNSLTGSLPSSLFTLSALTSISASNNMLTGSVPGPTVPVPSGLKSLNLSSNGLTGTFPDTVSYLSSLTYVLAGSLGRQVSLISLPVVDGRKSFEWLMSHGRGTTGVFSWQEIKCLDPYRRVLGSYRFFRTCSVSQSQQL